MQVLGLVGTRLTGVHLPLCTSAGEGECFFPCAEGTLCSKPTIPL